MKITDFLNKNIAILGFGAEGKSTLNFLLKNGIPEYSITILDAKSEISSEILDSEINLVIGDMYLDDLDTFDIIIKTPGISPYQDKILPYKNKLTSQTEIFFSNYSGKVIGVTATKGKSTTVSLAYETLLDAGFSVKLVGNIGSPVLDEVNITEDNKYDYIIYELSSYMLEGLSPQLFIGVLGNIFRCHIDWHNNDYEVYKQAKINILKNAENIIINSDLGKYAQQKLGLTGKTSVQTFGTSGDFNYSTENKSFYKEKTELFQDENIILEGEHNRINITSILSILNTVSQDSNKDFSELTASLQKVLATFKGLPHRMEDVGTYNGIRFIDDSISTTPDSTIAAIKTFSPNIGTIFLGGFDYGFEFKDFAQAIKKYEVKNIVFFPDTGADIKTQLDAINYSYNGIETNSMQEAVEFAFKNCKKGEVALLSCASPSFSMYNNYKERGYDFREKAKKLQK